MHFDGKYTPAPGKVLTKIFDTPTTSLRHKHPKRSLDVSFYKKDFFTAQPQTKQLELPPKNGTT